MVLSDTGGEGDGTPLQYSCLENRMDRGSWWAAVHGVTKSRTGLKRLSSSSSNTEAGKWAASLGRRLHQQLRVRHGLGPELKMPHRPLWLYLPCSIHPLPNLSVKRKLAPAQLTNRIQRRDAGSGGGPEVR